MKQLALPFALVALTAGLAGCADPAADEADGSPTIDVAWSAQPGEETQHCAHLSVDEAVDVIAIDTLAPEGTERLIAWYASPGDAAQGCPAVDVDGLVFDGLAAMELPAGVALRVPAGKELWLRADVVNRSDQPLSGTSSLSLTTTTQASELADVVALAADAEGADSCAMPSDAFLFAVASDVASDVDLELSAHSSFGGGDVTLFDSRADDATGARLLAQPVALRAGETVDAACTSRDADVSTVSESYSGACQAAVYRFPAAAEACQR